jgi:hypothetical protein
MLMVAECVSSRMVDSQESLRQAPQSVRVANCPGGPEGDEMEELGRGH